MQFKNWTRKVCAMKCFNKKSRPISRLFTTYVNVSNQ